jgi:CubicO group peptidase (beta-lactamase class C family)
MHSPISLDRHRTFAFTLLSVAWFIVSSTTAGFAQDTARMAEIVKSRATDNRFMGSVLVAKDGAVIFEQSHGWANAEWKIPNTATTKFRLGSVTKQFTAAAILLLAEQGKLQLDDPLSKFVPSAPATWQLVTLRQLLSHTAGVPGFTDHADYHTLKLSPQSPAQAMAHIAHRPLEFTPGEKFKYSNMGYILLGWIVEIASGQTYEAFLRQHIFRPLGMHDSGYDLNGTLIPERASGYMSRPGGLANAPYIDMHVPGGAGALYSTTRDMLRWSQGLFGGKLLSAASLEQMTTPVKNGYAFGLGVNTARSRKEISHNGGIEGFNSQFTYYPESKLTVVVLANIMGSPFTAIARDLAAIAFGETVTLVAERKAIEVPEAMLRRYVGVYQLGPDATNIVRLTDGHLTTQLTRQSAFDLWAESETKFFLKIVNAQVEFFADASGRVTHLVQYQNGREVKAERISDTVPE